jgi:arylformamidase
MIALATDLFAVARFQTLDRLNMKLPLIGLACALSLMGCGGGEDTLISSAPLPPPPSAANCKGSGTKAKQTIQYKSIAGVNPNLLSLDVYEPVLPVGCPSAPMVVFAHGGGYRRGDKAFQIADKVRLFAEEGWVFASINYRLSPDPLDPANPDRIKYPIHQQDAASALSWLLKNANQFNGDARKLMWFGHSAGAHLVSLVSTDESFLKAEGYDLKNIVCTAPLDTEIYDVTKALGDSDEPSLLWINAISDDPVVQARASPINYVAPGKSIPSFLAVTRGSAARMQQTTAFVSKLSAAGVSAQSINANPYSHEEVNDAVGKVGDNVVTPPLMNFFRSCATK